jgi:hypothetical protein
MRGYVSEQWFFDQGFLPNRYEASRYPKAARKIRRGSSAIIITEMTKRSGRSFGGLCSSISESFVRAKERGVNIKSLVLVKAMKDETDEPSFGQDVKASPLD